MQLLCADISPSGGLGVCSSEDGKLWVWEADSGEARVSGGASASHDQIKRRSVAIGLVWEGRVV